MKMHSPILTQDNIALIRELFHWLRDRSQGQKTARLGWRWILTSCGRSYPSPSWKATGALPSQLARETGGSAHRKCAHRQDLAPCREESLDFDTTKNLFY
jgi:hypothetical protein